MNYIKTKHLGNILTITLNRPEALNALNDELIQEIGKVLRDNKDDEEVYGVIITGTGEKAFAAGADIKGFPALDKSGGKALSKAGHEVFDLIESYPKPVLAAVNGYALGGGLELAMACHLRVAGENAVFGMPETKLGLIPGYGGTQRLVALIGKAKAMEYILTGDMMDASTATKLGLVNHVVVSENLIDKAMDIILKIGKRGPLAIAKAIETINASTNAEINGFELEQQNFAFLMESDQAKEGVAAFLEKRKPKFRG